MEPDTPDITMRRTKTMATRMRTIPMAPMHTITTRRP
jgi:hypothetical protein